MPFFKAKHRRASVQQGAISRNSSHDRQHISTPCGGWRLSSHDITVTSPGGKWAESQSESFLLAFLPSLM